MSAPTVETLEHELVGPRHLLLDSEARVHVVEAGTLALFGVDVTAGEPSGPRRFLRRIGAGQPLVSTPAPAAEGSRLLVVPIQRARLRDAPLDACWNDGLARRTELALQIDEWIDLLGQQLENLPEPSLPVRLGVPREVELEEGQDLCAERRRVIWVRALEGGLDLLGDEARSLSPADGPIPLGPGLWVRARGAARVEVRLTDGIDSVPELVAGLQRVESLLHDQLRRKSEKEHSEEQARLRNRSRLQDRRVRGALTELVSVLEPVGTPPDADPPLLAAVRVIGRSMGVAVRGPARSEDPQRMGDPLDAIARASRLRMRHVRLPMKWWRRDCGPMLAFWGKDEGSLRPVALLREKGRYRAVDPTTGRSQRVGRRFDRTMVPDVVTFSRPLPEGTLGLSQLGRFAIRGRTRDLLMVLAVGMAATLLGMLVPQATAVIMDNAVPDADRRLLLEIGLGLGAAVFGQAIFRLSERIVLLRVGVGAEAEAQAALWDRLLRLRPSFFRRYSSGDLQSRVMAVNQVGREITGNVLATLFSSLLALLNLGLLFYYSPPLSFLAVGVAGVVLITTLAFGLAMRRVVREFLELDGRFFGLEVQLIQAVSKLRVAGAEVRAFTHWLSTYTEQLKLMWRATRLGDAAAVFNTLVTPLSTMLLFLFAAQVLISSADPSGGASLSLGTFLAFSAAFGTFLGGVTSLSDTFVDFLDTAAKARRIEPILSEPPEIDDQKADPGRLAGQMALSRVDFGYTKDGPKALDGVSLRAEPGEFVALVGPSGSGKSTALRLLLGFETPAAGSVTYDGQDLSSLDVLAVRRQLGVVLQNGRLNSGSIFDNITSGIAISLDEAWAAAEDAGLADDVREMPMGMHTMISEGGGNISGGQRQRLLIARALATRPSILFLDEATSALDNRAQKVVSESLERLRLTRVVVAHRLSTIRHADRIYVLESGRVVEKGNFDQLMAADGLFARMMSRQLA